MRRTVPTIAGPGRGNSGAHNHFMGAAGQGKSHAFLLVAGDGSSDVQLSKRDGLGPGSAGPIIAVGVEHAVNDGVTGDFLASAIAENQRRRRGFSRRRGRRGARRRADGLAIVATDAYVTISLPLDQYRRLRANGFGNRYGLADDDYLWWWRLVEIPEVRIEEGQKKRAAR